MIDKRESDLLSKQEANKDFEIGKRLSEELLRAVRNDG